MQNKLGDLQEREEIQKLLRYRIYPEQNLVVVKLMQTVTENDIARWEYVMINEPLFKPDMDGVIDQREFAAQLSFDDVKELDELNKTQHKVNGRWVHLVNEPISTAMSYRYKTVSSDQQIFEVFGTVEAASTFFGYDVAPYLASL